ncbi:hypothetical protein BST43_06980 [Mycobacteroides saopaulense]|uniref:GmrSD restriction endonucleases N-terminal domain-containing protein n=2 Tax=Mycobacteroides saopaulense TaxID=1578165 RepID=A0A1X0J919_9MYCO|nr:hypothetical protein BST43_06980 [Mycobacteroides saopaulense]
MSIGELTNLYRDGELDVHPEFQRIFRWDDIQKTRLIESVLLGIPLPSIFVAQAEDGSWDVVDGVQRISTILQFQGILKDDDGKLVLPVPMEGTRLLPSLRGIVWQDDEGKNPSLSTAQRLDFKRAKLDLKIVKRESSSESKYDLFQRLNSYGSQATPQEVRSCMLIGTNRDFYQWLSELVKDDHYLSTLALGQRLIKEQYHLELALRFLVFRVLAVERLSSVGNLGEFLTQESLRMASDPNFDMEAAGDAFRKTFRMLDKALGDQVFRRWNGEKSRFQGAFLNTAFEVVGMGLGHYIDEYDDLDEVEFLERVKSFWANEEYSTGFATGVRADTRMAKSIPIGRSIFQR